MGNPLDPARRVDDLMARQHGVVGRQQAKDLGLSNHQIRYRLDAGIWIAAERSVYRHRVAPSNWSSTLAANCIATAGVASHRTAGHLWGIDGYGRPRRAEISIARGAHFRRGEVMIHESTQMAKADVVTIDGISTTGIARTVLDIAGVVGHKRLNWTLDSVIRQKLVTWPDLYNVLVRHSRRGRNGCGKLRAVLDVRYGDEVIPDSIWNRQVAQLLNDVGLQPQLELEVCDPAGQFIARVDLAFPRSKVAIELDSKRWHLNADSFVADPRRRNRLLANGWIVLSFTWDDYVDTPQQLCQTVQTTLRTRNFNAQ